MECAMVFEEGQARSSWEAGEMWRKQIWCRRLFLGLPVFFFLIFSRLIYRFSGAFSRSFLIGLLGFLKIFSEVFCWEFFGWFSVDLMAGHTKKGHVMAQLIQATTADGLRRKASKSAPFCRRAFSYIDSRVCCGGGVRKLSTERNEAQTGGSEPSTFFFLQKNAEDKKEE